MKKLTAGIFATILGLTAIGAAEAAIPTQNYVDEAVGSVRVTATTAANNAADALERINKLNDTYVSEEELTTKGYITDEALTGYAKTADVVTNSEFETFTTTNTADIADAKKAGTDAQTAANTNAALIQSLAQEVDQMQAAGYITNEALTGYAKTADVVTNSEFETFTTTNTADIADAKKAGTDAQTAANTNAALIQSLAQEVDQMQAAGYITNEALTGYAKTADVVTNSEFETFTTTNTANIADAKKAGTDAQTTANEALQGAEAANGVIGTLKSAAFTESNAYATAAQGAKADTALQRVTCANPDGCVLMADGTVVGLVNTYTSEEN